MIVRRSRKLTFNLGNYENVTLEATVEAEADATPEELDDMLNTYLQPDINRARQITALDNTQSAIHEEIWK